MEIAVVGMRAEASLLPPGMRVVVSGGDPARLRALLAAEDGRGVTRVLSFGIAGGLDPALGPGDLVVGTRVRGPAGAWRADPGWAAALARATGGRLGGVAGAFGVVAGPAAKRTLHNATGALAVDLESEAAAAFAAARSLPFVALRAVADTAEETLPQAAAEGLTPDGRPAAARVALALLRRPNELSAVIQVAKRTRTALAALGRAAAALPAAH